MATLKEHCHSLEEELQHYSASELYRIYQQEAHGAKWGDYDRVMRRIDRAGLDLFRDQAYIVRKEDKKTGEVDLEFRSSIAALRMRAEQTGKYAGQRGPKWTADGTEWTDVWIPDEPPAAAKVEILRTDFEEPMTAVVRFDEYAARYRSGDLMAMWAEMPAHMIAKCAEALGLKKAFPQQVGGIQTKAEMHRDDEGANERSEPGSDDDQIQRLNQHLSSADDADADQATDETDAGVDADAPASAQQVENARADDRSQEGPVDTGSSPSDSEGPGEPQGDADGDVKPESSPESGAKEEPPNGKGPSLESAGAAQEPGETGDQPDHQSVTCPYCGQPSGEPCVSDSGDEVDYYHKARKRRAKAKAGDKQAMIEAAEKQAERLDRSGAEDEHWQSFVADVSVTIDEWDDEPWEQMVSMLESYWSGAREECDLRRVPEALRE